MSGRARTCTVLVLLGAAAPLSASAQILTKDQRACLVSQHLAHRRSTLAAGAVATGCLKDAAKGKLAGSAEDCLASDPKAKIEKARTKTSDAFEKKCLGASRTPPYGTTDPAASSSAATGAVLGLVRDLLGPDLDATGDGDEATLLACRAAVGRAIALCHRTVLSQWNACTKKGVADGDAPIDEIGGIEACFGSDPKGKVAKACDLREESKPGLLLRADRVRKALAKKCGGVDLARAFPGCAVGDAEEAHACIARATACRACTSANVAGSMEVDCDLFDDGLANATCPRQEIGTLACPLDEEGGFLFDSAAGFLVAGLDGALKVSCGTVDAASGRTPCRCEIDAIDPVRVFGVGWACVEPAVGCPLGELSCPGGPSLDVGIRADHDLGSCASHAECASRCEGHCGASGARVLDAGCEGFCSGGSGHERACTSDAQCPGGICRGVAGAAHGSVCQCQCLDEAGAPSLPGGLRCHMGVALRVETALPCDRADVVFDMGGRCVPFTTEETRAILVDRDAVPGAELPTGGENAFGWPVSCPALASTGASGLVLASTFNAFDVDLAGDVHLLFLLGCE